MNVRHTRRRIALGVAALWSAGAWAALDLDTATVAEVEAAFADGSLTSEQLLRAYLARIDAYDQRGPTINAVIALNPKALDEARQRDAERHAGQIRGPLHGIPIVLKDNFDTFDLPTTAGSQLLAGSVPPDDAFVVKKLRDAGAIIVAKLNLHEFAAGGGVGGSVDPADYRAAAIPNGYSSMGGQTRNPHELNHGPAGSSTGTAAAIAAGFAQFGLGSDTTSSVRGPASATGIVGFKPSNGLLSRDGIVPLALSLDTAGPMARSVADIAVALNVMAGVDAADPMTRRAEGRIERDYTAFLQRGALRGKRIGIARDFGGVNAGVDRVFEQAVATLRALGATTVDFRYPAYLVDLHNELASTICAAEFKAQIADYLQSTAPQYPKTLAELARRAKDPATHYRSPQKAYGLQYTETHAPAIDDPAYRAAKNEGMALVRGAVDAVLNHNRLDAIVYLSSPNAAPPIAPPAQPGPPRPTASAYNIANLAGYPDLVVPAGMTPDGLPVTVSFLGPAFSDGALLGYGYDFEQATHARRLPKHTPALASDRVGR
ncbi:amidase family protein [Solimonas flava]|uniref:amidase family protein n=1 Tax=Solimonas flava TaxID=415849 RepID=UPI0003F66F08|nr:amidase family protein [Solimonas flava]